MFILPVMKDHLSCETTQFKGHFVQVSLYQVDDVHFPLLTDVPRTGHQECSGSEPEGNHQRLVPR